jgi:hypothetical protein
MKEGIFSNIVKTSSLTEKFTIPKDKSSIDLYISSIAPGVKLK